MDDIYDIEKILTHRKRLDGKYEYFVKWKGYDTDSNTWEPESNFLSRTLLDEYHSGLKSNFSDMESVQSANRSKPTKPKSKRSLEPGDLITAKEIIERNLVPEKVLNIFHVHDDEKRLVAHIRFKQTKKPEFVSAVWANNHCPKLVIKFYESRIFWRDKISGLLIPSRPALATRYN